jgi:hypothetical protein
MGFTLAGGRGAAFGAGSGEAVGVCWAKTKRAAPRRRKQKIVRFDIQRIVCC